MKMLPSALAILAGATSVNPIDVARDHPTLDFWVAGSTELVVYIDHLDVQAVKPAGEYTFYKDYVERYASRSQFRSKVIVARFLDELHEGKVLRKEISSDDVTSFKAKARVVIAVAEISKPSELFYVAQCQVLKDGTSTILEADPDLVRLYAGPWKALADCEQ